MNTFNKNNQNDTFIIDYNNASYDANKQYEQEIAN